MTEKSEQPPQPTPSTTDSNPGDQPTLPNLRLPTLQWEVQGAVHIGPVPAPQVLAGYGQIDPSFPDRIMTMAEDNARSARKTAERAQTFALAERLVARSLGLVFALGAIGWSAYLALHGHDGVASIIAGTTVVAVSAALIAGKSP